MARFLAALTPGNDELDSKLQSVVNRFDETFAFVPFISTCLFTVMLSKCHTPLGEFPATATPLVLPYPVNVMVFPRPVPTRVIASTILGFAGNPGL